MVPNDRIRKTQHRCADYHAEADGQLLGDRDAVAGAGVGVVQIRRADGVHGGELGGHRHAQHEQRQDHQPQRHARALQGELGDQYPDDNGDADQRFTVAEPAQHLVTVDFAISEPMAVGAIMQPATIAV